MAGPEHGYLLKRYQEYANSAEAFAVIFVKMHLRQARGHWVDPVDFRRYEMSPDSLHFRFVTGALYQRRMKPTYPPKSEFTANGFFDEVGYMAVSRAITWDVAHRDIEGQKSAGIVGVKFEVAGVSYDRNRGGTSFFRDDAPAEIKALARNLQDRTDPLWDHALKYARAPEFVYEVRKARVLGPIKRR